MSARFFLRKRRKQIPAFAGMTKSSSDARFLHALERGNPEAIVRYVVPFFLRKRRNGFPLSRE